MRAAWEDKSSLTEPGEEIHHGVQQVSQNAVRNQGRDDIDFSFRPIRRGVARQLVFPQTCMWFGGDWRYSREGVRRRSFISSHDNELFECTLGVWSLSVGTTPVSTTLAPPRTQTLPISPISCKPTPLPLAQNALAAFIRRHPPDHLRMWHPVLIPSSHLFTLCRLPHLPSL